MRSMKLLVAAALVVALVAGPVLAQDAMTAPASDTPAAAPAKPAKAAHKKHAKHHAKKAPAAAAPAAQ